MKIFKNCMKSLIPETYARFDLVEIIKEDDKYFGESGIVQDSKIRYFSPKSGIYGPTREYHVWIDPITHEGTLAYEYNDKAGNYREKDLKFISRSPVVIDSTATLIDDKNSLEKKIE